MCDVRGHQALGGRDLGPLDRTRVTPGGPTQQGQVPGVQRGEYTGSSFIPSVCCTRSRIESWSRSWRAFRMLRWRRTRLPASSRLDTTARELATVAGLLLHDSICIRHVRPFVPSFWAVIGCKANRSMTGASPSQTGSASCARTSWRLSR